MRLASNGKMEPRLSSGEKRTREELANVIGTLAAIATVWFIILFLMLGP